MRPMPMHWLHVYDLPKRSNRFIARYPLMRYRHMIRDIGNFYSASGTLMLPPGEADEFFERHVGARVAVFVDGPEPIWEGLITTVTRNTGDASFSRSLDGMTNRLRVIWHREGSATTINAAVNNTDSQDLWGIRATTYQGTFRAGTVGTMHANLRDLLLQRLAFPLPTISRAQGEQPVQVEMLGFWDTLNLEHEPVFGTSTFMSAVVIACASTSVVNANVFYNTSDTSEIQSNTSAAFQLTNSVGASSWQRLVSVAETGDGVSRWVCGIGSTQFGTNNRLFYYRPAETEVKYRVQAEQGLGRVVRDIHGRRVPLWNVRPEGRLRVTDVLPAWLTGFQGGDPREAYIVAVEYDADKQEVVFQGDFEMGVDGVMGTYQYSEGMARHLRFKLANQGIRF